MWPQGIAVSFWHIFTGSSEKLCLSYLLIFDHAKICSIDSLQGTTIKLAMTLRDTLCLCFTDAFHFGIPRNLIHFSSRLVPHVSCKHSKGTSIAWWTTASAPLGRTFSFSAPGGQNKDFSGYVFLQLLKLLHKQHSLTVNKKISQIEIRPPSLQRRSFVHTPPYQMLSEISLKMHSSPCNGACRIAYLMFKVCIPYCKLGSAEQHLKVLFHIRLSTYLAFLCFTHIFHCLCHCAIWALAHGLGRLVTPAASSRMFSRFSYTNIHRQLCGKSHSWRLVQFQQQKAFWNGRGRAKYFAQHKVTSVVHDDTINTRTQETHLHNCAHFTQHQHT